MDYDRDGRVSFSDFSQTVNKEPLMMEAFGTCCQQISVDWISKRTLEMNKNIEFELCNYLIYCLMPNFFHQEEQKCIT